MKREKKNARKLIKYINFSYLLSVFNPRLRNRQQFISGHYRRWYEVTLFHHGLFAINPFKVQYVERGGGMKWKQE